MEYVRGKDIGVMIEEQGPLSWPVVIDYGIQICRGLRNAHDHGVIHRDLKPVNFLVDEENTVKIADFGIARPWGDDGQTQAGSLLGTLAFMSPEQAEGKPVTNASDIYSLGASLFVMLTGSPPFAAPSIPAMLKLIVEEPLIPPRVKNPEIPIELDELICELMDKKAENRPRSAYNVECRLKDVTEFGQGRMFRKKTTQPRSGKIENPTSGKTEALKSPSDLTVRAVETNVDVGLPGQASPETAVQQRVEKLKTGISISETREVPQTRLDAQPANQPSPEPPTSDTNQTLGYRPTRAQSRDTAEADFQLRPVLDSNDSASETRVEESNTPDSTIATRSSGTFRRPVEPAPTPEWTPARKFLDAQIVVLLIALLVVVALAIWGKSAWRAMGFSGGELTAASQFISSPEADSPVTAEYGNSFNQVTKFFLTNHTSQPIESVSLLVKYIGDEHKILASTVIQTSTRGEPEKEIVAILMPNEAKSIVEPPSPEQPASGGFGRIDEPPGTRHVIVTVQEVTFMDQSSWMRADSEQE
jgi:serine/threonine protein kinase